MVIVVGNGICDASSNLVRGCFHLSYFDNRSSTEETLNSKLLNSALKCLCKRAA